MENKNLINFMEYAVIPKINIPKKYDIFKENFPDCCTTHKRIYDWWQRANVDEERAIYLTKWFFVYTEMFMEHNEGSIDLQLNKEILELFCCFLSAPERKNLFLLLSNYVTNNYEGKNKQEANKHLIPALEHHLNTNLMPRKNSLGVLEILEVFKDWINILPFKHDKEAIKYAQSLGTNTTIGKKGYNRFLGTYVRLHTKEEYITQLKIWGASMLQYYAKKLKLEQPEIAYRELRAKEHDAKQKAIYRALEDEILTNDLASWNHNVKEWLTNEKEYYNELRKDYQIEPTQKDETTPAPNYNWEQLTKDLIDNKYIAKDTPSDALQNFFSNKQPKQKIKWIDKASKNEETNKQTLFAFIDFVDSSLLKNELKKETYKRIANAFLKRNEDEITVKQITSSFSSWYKPWHNKKKNSDFSDREKRLNDIVNPSKK